MISKDTHIQLTKQYNELYDLAVEAVELKLLFGYQYLERYYITHITFDTEWVNVYFKQDGCCCGDHDDHDSIEFRVAEVYDSQDEWIFDYVSRMREAEEKAELEAAKARFNKLKQEFTNLEIDLDKEARLKEFKQLEKRFSS